MTITSVIIPQAQRSSLNFSLNVPGKGQVGGVLHYFPYDDRETVPVGDYHLVYRPIDLVKPGGKLTLDATTLC